MFRRYRLLALFMLLLVLAGGGFYLLRDDEVFEPSLNANQCGPERMSPAGLCWGISLAGLDSLQLTLGGTQLVEGQHNLLLQGIPADWDLAWNDVSAVITGNRGLTHLSMETDPIADDATGSKAKAEYERIKAKLSESYGPPTQEIRRLSRSLPGGTEQEIPADYFYSCLTRADSQCSGVWMARWEKDGETLANLDLVNASTAVGEQASYAGRLVVDLHDPKAPAPTPQ